ncbi:helix-turn-helix domain-containing protein [Serratia ureilytica]|uniref:helix-turn-helix domain-containing protein n=1 Tax=Serratia ureilytica TaxID=300181 RepID=UPI0018DA1B2A|nr:helix-turn-helix transcriptional regulator [Serratia ureilytica]MBH2883544.1 helix-turn-helix transcriptional regulator [Serratia ureilytica]MBH3123822.1 helix-turn-helix transcriptional regulator [Serratia ureilytica]
MKSRKTIHHPLYIQLIDALCEERKRLGLSQKEVAIGIGLSQADVSKIESKERRVDALELKKMLSLYRINENLKLKKIIYAFFDLE